MRIRGLVFVCALALTAASCAQDDPIVLSDAPPSESTTTTSQRDSENESESEEGRFIARCATEADGDAVPGQTIFTDGTVNVTDYCLSRFYVGVQPDPGSVYVADEETDREPPRDEDPTSESPTWTPSEPRTDDGLDARPGRGEDEDPVDADSPIGGGETTTSPGTDDGDSGDATTSPSPTADPTDGTTTPEPTDTNSEPTSEPTDTRITTPSPDEVTTVLEDAPLPVPGPTTGSTEAPEPDQGTATSGVDEAPLVPEAPPAEEPPQGSVPDSADLSSQFPWFSSLWPAEEQEPTGTTEVPTTG